ncbi:hypothetical protein ACULMB_05825 [Xanthomonas arboricola pv. corylina]
MSASTAGEVAIISQLPAEHGGDCSAHGRRHQRPKTKRAGNAGSFLANQRSWSCQPAILGGSLPAVY